MNPTNRKKLSGLGAFLIALLAAVGIVIGPSQPKQLPTPPAAATPTPAPSPVPSPAPSPTQAPEPVDPCNYPSSDGQCVFDPAGQGQFQAAVQRAQEGAAQAGFLTPEGKVKSEKAYTDEIARRLRAGNICAINGSSWTHTSEDEVWARDSESSFHYDIIRSDGVPILLYAARCSPPKF